MVSRVARTTRPISRTVADVTTRTDPQAGYTLLEMLVVLTIMVTIGAALAGFGGGNPGAPSHARTVADFVQKLRQARTQAITTGHTVALRLDTTGAAYGVDDLTALPDGTGFTLRTARSARVGGLPAIRFFPDGSASGGSVTLTGPSGQVTAIEVRWLTGRVILDPRP